MKHQITCPYKEPCQYSALNCDGNEFQFCKIFAKYANAEYQRQKARQEEMRESEMFDIGLVEIVTRINRGEDIDRLREEARA